MVTAVWKSPSRSVRRGCEGGVLCRQHREPRDDSTFTEHSQLRVNMAEAKACQKCRQYWGTALGDGHFTLAQASNFGRAPSANRAS
jgi:hypothetical protein